LPSTCMTDLEIDAFLRRELEAPRLLQIADHIAECENCRKKLARRKDALPAKTSVERDLQKLVEHITEEELQQYVTGKLDLARIRSIDGHLQRCAQCIAEVRDLRKFAASPAAANTQPRMQSAWRAGIMVVAVALVAFLWLRRSNELLVLNDSGNRVVIDRHGELGGMESLSERQRELVRQALSQQKLTLPPTLHDLNGNTGVLMGKSEPAPFRITRPIGTFINTLRPSLSWTADPESTGYKVTIHDESTGKNITSPLIQTIDWTLPEDLERSKTYIWQVVSLRKGAQEIVIPAPTSAPARFEVLNSETSAELRSLPSSHIARAILYANAGLLDDAEKELSALKAENPESSIVQDFLSQIEQSR
jgi:hypothetical protein